MSLTMPAEEEVAQHEGNIGSSIANQRGKKTMYRCQVDNYLHSAASNSVSFKWQLLSDTVYGRGQTQW